MLQIISTSIWFFFFKCEDREYRPCQMMRPSRNKLFDQAPDGTTGRAYGHWHRWRGGHCRRPTRSTSSICFSRLTGMQGPVSDRGTTNQLADCDGAQQRHTTKVLPHLRHASPNPTQTKSVPVPVHVRLQVCNFPGVSLQPGHLSAVHRAREGCTLWYQGHYRMLGQRVDRQADGPTNSLEVLQAMLVIFSDNGCCK